MRILAATALLAYANADETSLMQDKVKRSSSTKLSASADSTSSRQDFTPKLLDAAVNMIKNGVTPDVITFVDATNQDINEEVLVAIQSEHDIDQAYIDGLCQDFQNAVDALTTRAATIAGHHTSREEASATHQNCRAEEAYRCARSRRCEEQLRQKWAIVKHEEQIMREIHGHINDEWCIHPPFFAEIDVWLTHTLNWAQTSPYPILDLPQDVRDFRQVSVTYFEQYMAQKIVVERAWQVYNEKLVECSSLEEEWEDKIPECDVAQIALREHACQHASATRQAREEFGQEWERIMTLFDQAKIAKTANEQARKNEWETLKIVQCLLDHVHSSVITSIETGAPCPTIDSDPHGVTLAIEDCHIVTRGCGPDSLTAHLCLDWCDPPSIPPLPPVEEPACTPAYVAREQAQFMETIQASYNALLASDTDYPSDSISLYNTLLSSAGWAGCAPPLVCVDCTDTAPQPPCLEHTGGAHTCHLHEDYLSPGQSNADTFRCLDGSCILQAGRCNGRINCADGSDEDGCDADAHYFVPLYLTQSAACPDDFHNDVHFQCASGQCIEKVGLCNGVANCADGSDEAHCSGGLQLTVEATSGRTVSVETLEVHTGVFHDREYTFDNLGHFQGKTFIKYSNDDKVTDHLKVMTKIRTLEPLTVYIVKLDAHSLPWLAGEGYTSSAFSGVSFSGVRNTRDKEWDPSLLTTDHFAASGVYSKTFPAGTISIPGNGGGDGSFLIFVDRPSTDDEYNSHVQAPRGAQDEALSPSPRVATRSVSYDTAVSSTYAAQMENGRYYWDGTYGDVRETVEQLLIYNENYPDTAAAVQGRLNILEAGHWAPYGSDSRLRVDVRWSDNSFTWAPVGLDETYHYDFEHIDSFLPYQADPQMEYDYYRGYVGFWPKWVIPGNSFKMATHRPNDALSSLRRDMEITFTMQDNGDYAKTTRVLLDTGMSYSMTEYYRPCGLFGCLR